jgi:hypothetical protein
MRLDEDTAAREQHRYHIGAFFLSKRNRLVCGKTGTGTGRDGRAEIPKRRQQYGNGVWHLLYNIIFFSFNATLVDFLFLFEDEVEHLCIQINTFWATGFTRPLCYSIYLFL